MKALVAGDTGIIGRHLVDLLADTPNTTVVGISRGAAFQRDESYRHESADLLDMDSIAGALQAHRDITDVFYVARSPQDDAVTETRVNTAMLRNIVTGVDAVSPALRQVHLMEGMKWYGSHLGAWKTPAREDDPRHIPPNMYYDQQDWLEAQSDKAPWVWTALRPHQVCGFSDLYPHNAMGVIAIYGAICRELNVPLRFPGSEACYNSVSMVTDASLLARAMYWCATTEAAFNRPLNITNGDYFRWCNVWPLFAEFFDIPVGPVQTVSLDTFMSDKHVLWDSMVQRYGLGQPSLDALVSWQYGDFTFRAGWDDMASTTALRQAGFTEHVDTQDMFLQLLNTYRNEKIIP